MWAILLFSIFKILQYPANYSLHSRSVSIWSVTNFSITFAQLRHWQLAISDWTKIDEKSCTNLTTFKFQCHKNHLFKNDCGYPQMHCFFLFNSVYTNYYHYNYSHSWSNEAFVDISDHSFPLIDEIWIQIIVYQLLFSEENELNLKYVIKPRICIRSATLCIEAIKMVLLANWCRGCANDEFSRYMGKLYIFSQGLLTD